MFFCSNCNRTINATALVYEWKIVPYYESSINLNLLEGCKPCYVNVTTEENSVTSVYGSVVVVNTRKIASGINFKWVDDITETDEAPKFVDWTSNWDGPSSSNSFAVYRSSATGGILALSYKDPIELSLFSTSIFPVERFEAQSALPGSWKFFLAEKPDKEDQKVLFVQIQTSGTENCRPRILLKGKAKV